MNGAHKDKDIRTILTRGVENIYPDKEFALKFLGEGIPRTIYLGIDPTGPTLHLGHAIVLKKMGELQAIGHKVILLIGDFTARIGDPTDKSAVRKQLSKKEVRANAGKYKKQASIFLKFSGRNKAKIKYNTAWLEKMKFEEVLHLASYMTVDRMLKRDMFEKRMKEGKPVYIHEFLYPLMQGYDSVAMNVDGEIGGNDQTFNMLTGRTLMRQILHKEKLVITTKLLEDKDGIKMGKTEGNMITLADSPQEMFGKTMSWKDNMIVPGFELCTNVPEGELQRIKNDLHGGKVNPRDIKMQLAEQIVSIFYGEKNAQRARDEFVQTFQKKQAPDDVKTLAIPPTMPLIEILAEGGIAASKSEARRLVKEGAVKDMNTKEKISDPYSVFSKDSILKIGKRKFIKIEITR